MKFKECNICGGEIEFDTLRCMRCRVLYPEHNAADKGIIKDAHNTHLWAVIKDQYMISPIYGGNGRVLVQEDPYKSKYECTDCGGVGHKGVVCKYCKGTKFERGKEENGYCRDCSIGEAGSSKTLGHEACPTCHGTGGTIVIPDENQRNTTTGQVLAISARDILEVRVGDKVMFTNYSGSPFKFMDLDLRVIIEKDLLGKVKQLKKNVEGLTEGNFAELDNAGVSRV
jgi:co-chaperonin GroES (HSP10)